MTLRQIIDQEDFINQPELPSPAKEDYSEIITAMETLAEQMASHSYEVKVEDQISIANFDEIKLYLRQELSLALKPLIESIKKLDKKPTEEIKVSNLKEIVIPEQKEITFPQFPSFPTETNLSKETITEMRHLFIRLGDVIKKSLVINVPQANVVVNTPEQKQPIVNVEAPNLEDLLVALAPLQRFFNDDEEPFVVKFQNDNFFEELKNALKDSNKQMVGFAGGPSVVSLRNANATTINPATEETLQSLAGLVTQPYDYIDLSPPSLPTTITFKKGGITVTTLTLTYSGTDLATVSKA